MTFVHGRRLLIFVPLTLVAALAGCASPFALSDPAPSGVPTPAVTESFGSPTGDDALVVRYDDTELHIASMDAASNLETIPDDLPSLRAEDVYVFVPQAGWTLSAAQFTGEPYECDEWSLTPEQTDLGGGWWAVRPVGQAGDYTLQLSAASGPGLPLGGEVGAVGAYIALQTTTDRPLPPPVATLDVLASDDEPGSVSVSLIGLSVSPAEVTSTVTLTGPDGDRVTVAPASPADTCNAAGDELLTAELSVADAETLGDVPYDYDIELTLDGQTYRATGSLAEGMGDALEFAPPLP
ncbi:hypothetical protein [Microbacterium terricola]|uniref:Uncharacterized protein n=1 Tax=Microbacterium terricola TaxID=344163 RepID=A0ABM8DZF1_9MICO|nr:hypothetical protein [Microbacterium terricola]UYK41182.1 hypothetical protein OAU46_05970 [Microbacterium terricola]BDV31047.1 hypothetical protein Microterr_17070 [Microbacterium terricola]